MFIFYHKIHNIAIKFSIYIGPGMNKIVHSYPVLIKEIYLDTFGHVNNAMYLTLFEEARWDWITAGGFGLETIKKTRLGPTILEVNLRYTKELRLRDAILIETQLPTYKGKIGKVQQCMRRDTEICCVAEFTIGLFSLDERKLVFPTPAWLRAVGMDP